MAVKYVLVTGASRGIGKSTALLFARNGYHVFLNCRKSIENLKDVQTQITDNGGTCSLVAGDIGNPDDVKKMFEEIHKTCDALDVLVNNAGISHIGLLSDMSNEEWRQILDTNLSSVFYCCRAAIPGMIGRKSGKIINISSIWGTVGASCEVAYSASKSGVNGLTRALAKELAPSNIQVNALACGVIDTTMNGQLNAEERAQLEYNIPAGRFGTSEETAQMIWNLAHAPSYLTGQVIGMDGGF